MKKAVSVIIALILVLTCTPPLSSAYQTTAYHVDTNPPELFSSSEGACLLWHHGGDCHIEKLFPDARSADIHLDHPIAAVKAFGNTVVALCNDVLNHQLEVYTYRIDIDVLDSFAVNDVRWYGSRGFHYDGSSIYLVSDRSANRIERYLSSDMPADSYSFDSGVLQIGTDYRGNIFAISAGVMYRLSGNRFTAYKASNLAAPVTFASDQLFTDAAGRCYEISGDSCRQRVKCDADYAKVTACCIDGVLYYPAADAIYGYVLSTGKKRYLKETDNVVIGVAAYRGYVYAVSENGNPSVSRIRTDAFTDLRQESTRPPGDDTPQQSGNITVDDQPRNNGAISSAAYRINYGNYSISGIPSGTTIAQFKQNISFEGYQLSIFRNGTLKKDGNCGTAMTAVFESDSAKYTFELSVIGDITGEGNVNSRDLSLFMEYLLGIAVFNGVYVTSADLSSDGVLDVKDLALLHRMY